jgi:alkaline phosphatase D
MTIAIRRGARLSRRMVLTGAAATFGHVIASPYLSRAADRPRITHGIQSGDVAGLTSDRSSREPKPHSSKA